MDKIQIKINALGEEMAITTNAGNHKIIMDADPQMGGKDKGPNPLQTLLSTLAACENITAVTVAKEINFDLQGISFKITGELDPRGMMGDSSVRTYFKNIKIEAKLNTTESEERINELQKIVESRCPTYGLFKAANINMMDDWIKA